MRLENIRSAQRQELPDELRHFINTLTPDDVGVDTMAGYRVHYEGFSDWCKLDAEQRCNLPPSDPRHLATYDDVYEEVLRDFVALEGGRQPIVSGLAGSDDNPIFYAIFPVDDVANEAWSNKYKKSINCSNPKGFSQKAHCAARRKRAHGGKTKSKPVREGATSESAILDKPTPSVAELAKRYDVDHATVQKQVERGIEVELEHTNDRNVAREIAMDHIGEDLLYYDKLATAERGSLTEAKRKRAKTLIDGMVKTLMSRGRTKDEAVADLKKQIDARFYENAELISDLLTESGMLTVNDLAAVGDAALDKAYGYGRSSPGNTFGWQANVMSATHAKKLIDAGITDIEKISDAIHQGWNVTARRFVDNPDQFADTESLRKSGKLDAKLQQRDRLSRISYEDLSDDEKEKDRVVARALLQAILGDGNLDENLRDWFKQKWVRFGPDGKIRGACARGSDSEGKPKCLPQKKAHSLGKKGRASAARRKRREDPNPERHGKAKNVRTKESIDESAMTCPHCGGMAYGDQTLAEKKDACYYKVKSRYKVWPSAYASGALVQCRKKGAKNWGKGKAEEGLVLERDAKDKITNAVIDFYRKHTKLTPPDDFKAAAEELIKAAEPGLRDKIIHILKQAKGNPYLQGGFITTIGALLAGKVIGVSATYGLSPYQTNLMLQAILNTVIPALVSRINGRDWKETIKYTLASAGVGTGIAALGGMDEGREDAVHDLMGDLGKQHRSLATVGKDERYDRIDAIMQRVAKANGITAKELHDAWMERFKELPDDWVLNEEKLTRRDPVEVWIRRFKDSTHPKFSGKSPAEREKMARMAHYRAVQNYNPFTVSGKSPVREIAKVRISKDPSDLGAYVDDEGDPEPTVDLPLSKITSVLEPDEYHAEKPGAAARIARMVKSLASGESMPAILVRRHGDGYQVLDGHHRFKAYRKAGAKTIPARIVDPKNITGDVDENFADGKGPGRPGDSQRHGIPKGATMAQLQKAAKAPGRKGQLARWQINMRRGRAKAEEGVLDSMADAGKYAMDTAYGMVGSAADAVSAFGRSAADTVSLGGYKYARAGADYIAKQALKNIGYGSGTEYDKELRQEIEKLARDEIEHPQASAAGKLAGVIGAAVAPEVPMVGGVAAGGYKANEVAQKAATAYKYAKQMLGLQEGDVIQTRFGTKKAASGKSPYVYNPDIAAVMPLYDPSRRFGVAHKRPADAQGGEIAFDRFEVNDKSERTSDIIGIIGDKRVVVSTTRPDVARVLADAWNRGGFTAADIEMVKEADDRHGAALTVFDMDETLFHTKAKIYVVKDGEVVRKLDNQEYNTYQLKPGESYDYREFRDAKLFHDTSVPIERMWRKAQNLLDNIGKRPGSRVIIVTARTDLDDRETFLNTFRKHGLDIDKVHVHRAGNLPVPAAAAKKAIIATYLNTGRFNSVRLFDDAESNLRSFLQLRDEYPDIKFTAYLVLPGGHVTQYES